MLASWFKKMPHNFVTKVDNCGHSAPALTQLTYVATFELIEKDQFKYILKCETLDITN